MYFPFAVRAVLLRGFFLRYLSPDFLLLGVKGKPMRITDTGSQQCRMGPGAGTGSDANQAATTTNASVKVVLAARFAQLQPTLGDSPDTVAITVMEMLGEAVEEVLC